MAVNSIYPITSYPSNDPQTNPRPNEAQRQTAPGSLPPGAVLPPPPNETKHLDPKVAAARAQILVDNAVDKKSPMRSFFNLSNAYEKASPDIRNAILANRDFKKIRDETAKTLIEPGLSVGHHREDQTSGGDAAIEALYRVADPVHQDLRRELVISATHILVRHSKDIHGKIFSHDHKISELDQMRSGGPNGETYIEGLGRLVGSTDPGAVSAVKQLGNLVADPAP